MRGGRGTQSASERLADRDRREDKTCIWDRHSHSQIPMEGQRWRVLGARCGESRSPVLSPGSMEPRREAGTNPAVVAVFARALTTFSQSLRLDSLFAPPELTSVTRSREGARQSVRRPNGVMALLIASHDCMRQEQGRTLTDRRPACTTSDRSTESLGSRKPPLPPTQSRQRASGHLGRGIICFAQDRDEGVLVFWAVLLSP